MKIGTLELANNVTATTTCSGCNGKSAKDHRIRVARKRAN